MKRNFLSGKVFIVLLIGGCVFSNMAYGQEDDSKKFIGKWITGLNFENSLRIGEENVRIALSIADEGGVLITKITSPDSDLFNAVAEETEISEDKIRISFGNIKTEYHGTIKNNIQLSGRLTVMGKTFSLSLKKVRTD